MANLSSADRTFVRQGDHDFGSIGRHIRNEYGLWWSHPLTEQWRSSPENRVIEDGVDMSPDHPDQIAAEILAIARTL